MLGFKAFWKSYDDKIELILVLSVWDIKYSLC